MKGPCKLHTSHENVTRSEWVVNIGGQRAEGGSRWRSPRVYLSRAVIVSLIVNHAPFHQLPPYRGFLQSHAAFSCHSWGIQSGRKPEGARKGLTAQEIFSFLHSGAYLMLLPSEATEYELRCMWKLHHLKPLLHL